MDRARALVAAALERRLDEVPPDGTIASVPGWDSLGHVRIVLALEAARGQPLKAEEIATLHSVAAVAAALADD